MPAITTESMSSLARERAGVVFGSGIGGLQTFQEQTQAYLKGGPRRLSPFFIPMMIPDMASGVIAIRYGFRGPNHCVVSACATGNHNIGDAHDADPLRRCRSHALRRRRSRDLRARSRRVRVHARPLHPQR